MSRYDPILDEPGASSQEVYTVDNFLRSFADFGGFAGEVVGRLVGVSVVISDGAVEDLLLSEVRRHLAKGGGGETALLFFLFLSFPSFSFLFLSFSSGWGLGLPGLLVFLGFQGSEIFGRINLLLI